MNDFYLKQGDGFLPQGFSAKEFFTNVVVVKALRFIPKNIRKVFLISIISKMQNFSENWVFEKSFLGYLESSSFLFNFFDELALFCIDLEQIPLKDTYGDYEEHLNVLFEIYRFYNQELERYGFYDVLYGRDYEILREYFKDISCVEFYLDGFLSVQERQILEKIQEIVPVYLHIECDMYNQGHFGFLNVSLQKDYAYRIELATSEISLQKSLEQIGEVNIFGFASRMSQAALVFERVNEWLGAGIDAEKLAIIIPNEGFSKYLKLLDTYNNLNFAMGKSIETSPFISALKMRLKSLKEVHNRIESNPLDMLKTEIEILLENSTDKEVMSKFHQEILFSYEKIASSFEGFGLNELLELYILDLLDFRIDDVGGGKVKVMGVLECRGLHFERVVIVDFNDEYIPGIKDSDMFLNTKIRKSLKIPTLKDRQDLQKHYYLQIFKNTKKIDIAFVDNENSSYSKMIDELGLQGKIENGDEKYRIFPFNQEKKVKQECFIELMPRDFIFSASKINDFFSCRRKFYYKYLKKIKSNDSNSKAKIGVAIHQILFDGYRKYINAPLDIEKIKKDCLKQIDSIKLDSLGEFLDFEFSFKSLEAFWENESNRVKKADIVVLDCEKTFEIQIAGFPFKGVIDRIDNCDGEILLIDYKFKSNLKVDKEKDLDRTSDFQLPVYFYAAKYLGYANNNIKAYYYDLKEGKMKEEETLEIKATFLESKLKVFEKEVDFQMTHDRKICSYCDYKDICGI
ncbi:PD-(D/E)XK nuclease family protein [Helicobacter sp. 13S00477-4]|uniref:PD-(D/E)XK nuclease family protein n=1 Tax=Helicobacter sp. 13S00477-4 TaxID=1905759 RepID=UPI0015DB28D6|nr:PD-(D/E)XK nuclease family protein [Helicobacter sp. 13S00477-4]